MGHLTVRARLALLTVGNAAIVAVLAILGLLGLLRLDRTHQLLHDLDQQKTTIAELTGRVSELERMLLHMLSEERAPLAPQVLAGAEDLQDAFDAFRDVARKHGIVEDLSFAQEAEPVISALRGDIVHCVLLLRQDRKEAARAHLAEAATRRMKFIREFGETSLYAKHLQIGRARRRLADSRARLLALLAAAFAVLTATGLLGGRRVASAIVGAIDELRVGSERISNGELHHRVHVRTGDEIERVADEFNRMAEKVAERTAHLEKEITERRRTEASLERYAVDLERANEEVKQFAYIVSHDLRAPLVNLKGFTAELGAAVESLRGVLQSVVPDLDESQQRAVAAVLEEDVPEAMGFIESSVTRMDGFISALLRLSRLGRRELTFEPLDTDALVQATLESLAHQIEAGGTKVIVGPLPEAIADRTAMEQIVGNLLSNAVLYLDPARPGEIEIAGERGEDKTTFRVRDNGRGIADEDMDKVFAPFRRAGRQDVPGEGMGLAYVQALVRGHGGRMWCESELGVGTTFTFTLPNHLTERDCHAEVSRRDGSPGRGRPGACPPDREEPASLGHSERHHHGRRRPAGAGLPAC